MSLELDAAGLVAFLEEHFPQALATGFTIDHVGEDGVSVGLVTDDRHLRPGGTVMGPVLMSLADTSTYLAILAREGPLALAVTSSLELHFLRRPRPGHLVAHARLLKLGRRLAVAQVDIRANGEAAPVAHGTVTYSLPR
ncbi:MAG: PaaI family thioesterase [Alphaproteobacteria bacterium]|nr:PaaI family thioesterase [Alphaproteobacteria bacterium]